MKIKLRYVRLWETLSATYVYFNTLFVLNKNVHSILLVLVPSPCYFSKKMKTSAMSISFVKAGE